MRIFLVRHGETEHNISGLMQGQQPGKLTDNGKLQAIALAERLKSEKFNYAYSSDLTRASDTIKEILVHHNYLEAVMTSALRERALGVYEGQLGHAYYEGFTASGAGRLEFKPEGGESILEVHSRTNTFLEEIRQFPEGSNILLCTHGGVITTILATLMDATAEEMLSYSFGNTSLSIIEIINGVVSVTCFNCTAHLNNLTVDI